MSAEKPKVVFVLGAPGSGKGTQCARIVEQFGYVHLSAGDLLRAERNRPGSELAEMIEESIKAARIIPVAVTCSLLDIAMTEQMKVTCKQLAKSVGAVALLHTKLIEIHVSLGSQCDATKNKFLIDGFPRNQDNLDGWLDKMSDKTDLQFVLFFECPDSVCIDRCLSRGTGRVDDNMDSLKKRFDVFHNESLPIVDYYDKKNLVRRVDSEPPPELVFDEVRKAFADYGAQ